MAKKRRKRKTDNTSSDELYRSNNDDRTRRRRERRGKFPRKLVFGLMLLGILIFFLPSIVVRTPLKQILIDRVLADFNGTVTVESISCGWIANTELINIEATDEQGQPLFSVGSVKMRKSLTSIINASDYGTIEIERPVLNLKLRPDGSNLEDAIVGLIPTEENSGPSPAVHLVITEGSVAITDSSTGRQYELNNLNASIEAFQPDEAPLRIDVDGIVANKQQGGEGSFNAKVVFDAGKDDLEFQNGLIELTTETLPIEFVSPVVSRFVEPIYVAGAINGAVNAAWSDGGASFQLKMEPAEFSQLVINAPNRIGQDQIRLANAWLKGSLSLTPKMIQAERLVCYTEAGSLKADGELNWEQIAAVAGAQIPANNFQAEGSINLAPLVAMLPNTIPLQSGMQIESGTIQFNANSRVEGTDRRMVINLESTGLTATRGGQRLNWDKPARIVAAVRQTSDDAMYVESLDCRTNFLTLNGSATSESGEFRLQGDLKSALAEAGQFLDLGETQLEGIIDGKFAWQFDGSPADKVASRPLRAGGRFHVDKPMVNLTGQNSWAEDELNIVVQMAGQRLGDQATQPGSIRLDSGKLELVNARQSFEANLIQPIINPGLSSIWQMNCKLGGDVQTWLSQIAAFAPVQARATGNVDATATVTIEKANRILVDNANYEFKDLNFQGYGLTLTEPQLGGTAELGYVIDRGILQVTDATLASSALSARAQNVVVDSSSEHGSLSGQLAFLADINRCLATVNVASRPDAVQWFGRANGTIDLATTTDAIGSNIAIDLSDVVAAQFQRPQGGVQNVSAGGSWVRLLEEKTVSLQSTLQLSRAFDQVTFENTKLVASAAEVTASGTISDFAGSLNTDIQGSWNPNWQKLKPLADSMLSGLASLTGVQGGAFRMQGPVFNPNHGQPGQPWLHPQLRVATVAAWQSGQVLGLPIGGSQLELQVADGIANVNSHDIPFSNGIMRLAPRLDMRGEQMMLYLPPSKVLENVELTPQICRGWLKYVAPVIAGATTAQGRISLSTNNVQVPLGRWDAASANGVATVHNASIGPGPVGQQLFKLVNQLKAIAKGQPFNARPAAAGAQWLTIPEQDVAFALQDGRVIHQGLEFHIDDVVIRTSGSVGMDQSMDLVAEIQILPNWVGDNPMTQRLKGQTLRIPIRGTILKPRLDGSILKNLSKNLFQQAAGETINNEIQGFIEKGNQRLDKEVMSGLKGLFGSDK